MSPPSQDFPNKLWINYILYEIYLGISKGLIIFPRKLFSGYTTISFIYYFSYLVEWSGAIDKHTKVVTKKSREQVLCDLVAKENFTLHQIVNSEYLKEYFEMKRWEMPKNASTVSKIIKDHAKKEKEHIACKLKGAHISIQLDEWTSSRNIRYMSVVATTSNESFNLGLGRIDGSATADNLLAVLLDKLNEYKIDPDNVIGCTSDGASVIVKLQREFKKMTQLCYAHAIHLSVIDFLVKKDRKQHVSKEDFSESEDKIDGQSSYVKEDYQRVISKMSKIINSFSHSALLCSELSAYQIKDKTEKLQLVTFVKTRWNSMFAAVERILKVHPQLLKTIIDHNLKKNVVIINSSKNYFFGRVGIIYLKCLAFGDSFFCFILV